MAETHGADTHGDMDIKQHTQTYGGVMNMLKWGTVASFVLAMIVILLISN